MKLPQLQSLLPSRGMMFVALGLSLAIGWYFYNSSGVADHLTKRNFNYLNQIGSNLDASVDAAEQYVRFAGKTTFAAGILREYWSEFERVEGRYELDVRKKDHLLSIAKPSPEKVLKHAVSEVLMEMKSRLVSDGHLVSDASNVSIEINEEQGKSQPVKASSQTSNPQKDEKGEELGQAAVWLSLPAKVCMNTECKETVEANLTSNSQKDEKGEEVGQAAVWLSLPAKVCMNTECKETIEAHLTISEPKYAPVELASGGIKTTISMRLGVPRIGPGNCDKDSESGEETCKPEAKKPNKHLVATFSLTIPFADVQGVGNGETAFDTVLLAKSEGTPDGSPLIFSNVDEQTYVGDIFHLLNVSSRFERFSSIRDFERHNSSIRTGPPFADSKPVKDDKLRAFTQSTVIPLQIGGFSKMAYVQPFTSAHLPGEDKLVLIGIVSESEFNKSKYAVPYNWLSDALLLLLLGVLSLNFARLKLIKSKGILKRSDIYISIFSLAGVASLFVVFLIQVIASWDFNALFNSEAKKIHAGLSTQFANELDAKLVRIQEIHSLNIPEYVCEGLPEGSSDYCLVNPPKNLPADVTLGSCTTDSGMDVRMQSATSGSPEISTQFLLDNNGVQNCYYFTYNQNLVRSKFNVESREYFKRIHEKESWRTHKGGWSAILQEDWSKPFRGEFYLNRIESKTNGAQQTAISLPSRDGVLVALAKFYSLEHTVLPPGHGFSVFDNETGLVLFASNESRNLRENFYRATDDNEELKSTVISRSKRKVRLTYKGDLVDAIVSPLKNTRWTLVTFHHRSIVDAFNFHLGTSALILGGIYGAVFLVALPALILLLGWLYRMTFSVRVEERFRNVELPQWIFPELGKFSAQRSLGIALLQLVLAYVACIYFFDLPEARLWMLIVIIAVPCCWFYLLHMSPDSEDKVPIGTLLDPDKGRHFASERSKDVVKAFGFYRLNITLSILLLAVLPTLLLSNENSDIHQRQWLQFSHWFNVEQFKQRSAAYEKLNAKFRRGDDSCPEKPCERSLRGVFIPGMNLSYDGRAVSQLTSVENAPVLAIASSSSDASGKSAQKRDQTGYLDSILSMLPSFGVEGELLEGLDESRAIYDRDSSKLQIETKDPVSGMSYTSTYDFPQTRPRDLVGISLWTIFYVCMVLVSAVIIASLGGFLMRRFLSRSFEENILDLTTQPIAHDLADGAIVVRPSDVEAEDAYHTILGVLGLEARDFEVLAGSNTPENQVVATEKAAKLIIVRDFFSVTQDHAISSDALAMVRQRMREGYSLIVLSDIDPNHWAKSDQVTQEAFEQWEGIINSLSTFMLPIFGEGRSLSRRGYLLSPRVYKRVWRRCSEDEQMVLAGLCHEGIVNPLNESTLRSLYRRRLVSFQNSHFEFGDINWREYVAENLKREDFRERARRYKNSVWISFRGPMILILLVLVMFIAYVAQDEMRLLFSLIASIGAGAGALTALGGSLRSMANKMSSE
ncbi:MAG: cache domain-containing protein [Halioglobus sp.]